MDKYQDRKQAGQILAQHLSEFRNQPDTLVLGLPRGGVPVAYEVAKQLALPLQVFIVRKIGMPGHEEFAIGAVASGEIVYLDKNLIERFHIKDAAVQSILYREKQELHRREVRYAAPASHDLAGKSIILVDDGIATGATMHAAILAIKSQKPAKIIVAVPVASPDVCQMIGKKVDKLICPLQPDPFFAVGLWYVDFGQTTDEEVCELLGV